MAPDGPSLRPAKASFVHDVPPAVTLRYGALTHPGKVRSNNEDHYLLVRRTRFREILATNLPEGSLEPSVPEAFVYGIADGMGGAAFGELASQLALTTGWELGGAATKWTLKLSEAELAELRDSARQYFQAIDRAIAARSQRDLDTEGMGTTLTVAYTLANAGLVIHAGDSRAYLLRAGRLERLTRDHTLAEGMAEMGIPVGRAYRSVLTSHLGDARSDLRVDVRQFEIQDGDVLLLCTDGLTDMVPEGPIASLLSRCPEPQDACQALVDLALDSGGRDNVTVLVGCYSVAQRA